MKKSADGITNVRSIVERVWRARFLIVGFQAITILLTLFVLLFWPRTYSSTSQLYIQRGRESVGLDATANATGKTIALQQAGRDAEINSAIDVLSSRGIIEPVVDKLSPEVVKGEAPLPGSSPEKEPSAISKAINNSVGRLAEFVRSIDKASLRERAVVEIEKNLVVAAERKSEIISVTFEADSPELAQAVVGEMVAQYKMKHSDLHRMIGSTEFFDEQSGRLREEMEAKAALLRDAKNRMGIATIAGQHRILEGERLGRIRMDIDETDKNLGVARARAKNLSQQLSDRPERVASAQVTKPSHGADLQSQLLYQQQINLMDAKAKLKSNHPKVRALEVAVAAAKKEHTKRESVLETTDDVNPVYETLKLQFATVDAELAGLEARKKRLLAQETEVLQEIRQLNQFETELAQLKIDFGVAQEKYRSYATSYEEARADKLLLEGSLSSVSISQAATLQEKPVSPSKPMVVICGGLLCLVGSVLIAFFRVVSDDTLISKHAASQALDLPVLGVMPQSRAFATVRV